MALLYTDGFADNVFPSGFTQCIEEYLYDGVVTSLSSAADCLAKKAYWLGLNQEFMSPWHKEFKIAVDAGEEIPNGNPEPGYPFLGGKHDDITVTVAQIFKTEDGERKGTAAKDTHFKKAKTLYKDKPPFIKYDKHRRAKFHKFEDQWPNGIPTFTQ